MLANSKLVQKYTELDITSSAYIHIPFCRRRCYYCDFPVSVVGDRLHGDSSGTISHYVDVLCQEIAITTASGKSLETIFFGGGTPSLLSVNQLSAILETLDRKFGISPQAEISMEIDPGTFTLEQLQGYLTAGINRVSLGVQTFEPELLKVCGRSHTLDDVWTAFDLIRQAGVKNFSLDLISGLPHQTLAQWQASLETAVAMSGDKSLRAVAPNHISIYDLTIEPGTAFGRYYQPGSNPLPSDDLTVQMYCTARQVLTDAGYEHYEISNYAQKSYQCRHNRVYWENRPYYGFGMGAASYVEGKRFTRPRKTKEYYEWVQDYIVAYGAIDCPPTPPDEVLLETLMLGLRLAEGVSLSTLAEKFGEDTLERIWLCLQPYYQKGWVEVVGAFDSEKLPGEGRLRLSDPQGFLFSNVVLADLFSQLG